MNTDFLSSTFYRRIFGRVALIGSILMCLSAVPARAAAVSDPPPIDTTAIPDSIKNLIFDVIELIDEMVVDEETKVESVVDSSLVRPDTVQIITTFVEDTLLTRELQTILGEVIDIETVDSIAVPAADTLAVAAAADTTGLLPAITIPRLTMCPEARAILRKKSAVGEVEQVPVNPIFMPIIFDGQLPENRPTLMTAGKEKKPLELYRRKSSVERDGEMNDLGRYAQARYIVDSPDKIRYTPEMMPEAIHIDKVKRRREFLTVERQPLPSLRELSGHKVKLKHWISELKSALQISQIYISENWYQGGTSNINLVSTQNYSLEYKDYEHDKMLFKNTIQWKLNISSAPDDTLRSYAISEDLFQIDSKFGYKAFGSFYYSASVTFKTQFFNHHKKNTHNRTASFLSPGEMNLNLGMTYNFTSKNKAMSTSLALSPLAYNLKCCIDKEIDPAKFGIEAGKKTINKVGSSFDATLKWQFMRNMSINSHLYYFTSYDRVQIDFENTFNFVLNRYFSTRLEFKMRYDDSVQPNAKGKFLQFKELLSFGLYFRI